MKTLYVKITLNASIIESGLGLYEDYVIGRSAPGGGCIDTAEAIHYKGQLPFIAKSLKVDGLPSYWLRIVRVNKDADSKDQPTRLFEQSWVKGIRIEL